MAKTRNGVPDLRVVWSDAARDDLRAIVFHIAQDSSVNALAMADRLERRAASLRSLAARGRMVPELRRTGERRFRGLIEKPWRVIYLVEDRGVSVVAVVDGCRDLHDWLNVQATRFKTSAINMI